MSELEALFTAILVAVGVAIWEIRGYVEGVRAHLEGVHASLLERCDRLDKSIAALEQTIDQMNSN